MEESWSPALRAAILAALTAFEEEEQFEVSPALPSRSDAWRLQGRRAQMNVRFEGWRVLPSLPAGRLGWQRAPGRAPL